MDLAVIIVSWNVREQLKKNLAALLKSAGDFSMEIYLVDNNSSDGTAAMVKENFPQVKLIANPENLGFARANNQALKLCRDKFKYVLLLNPDMRVFDDTLSNMVSWMNWHERAWVAGCRLIDENSRVLKHVRRFPSFFDQLAVILKLPHLFPSVLNEYLASDFDYKKSAPVDSVRGGFFLIRDEALKKVGWLDESYFLWFEEVDYCRRVSRAGGEVWFSSAAECIDLVGQSFKQVNRGVKQKYFRDSMLIYFKKWRPAHEYWLLKMIWPLGLFISWLGDLFKIKSRVKT